MRLKLATALAALTVLAATQAQAETFRCRAKAAGTGWRTVAEATFVDGVRQGGASRVEAWVETPFPGEDSIYGINVDTASTSAPVGWVAVTVAGTPERTLVDYVSPQLFNFDDVMMGRSQTGEFPARMRLSADGAVAALKPAILVGADPRFPTGVANNFLVRLGALEATGPDNREAAALGARLARASELSIEVLDDKGATVLRFALPKGAWREAMAARATLERQIAADLAAGRCTRL